MRLYGMDPSPTFNQIDTSSAVSRSESGGTLDRRVREPRTVSRNLTMSISTPSTGGLETQRTASAALLEVPVREEPRRTSSPSVPTAPPRSVAKSGPRVAMLLSNGCAPDPRVEHEARALAAAGADVTIFGWDREGRLPVEERRDGYRVHRVRVVSEHGLGSAQALVMPRVWRDLRAAARRMQPDVVHAHDLDTLPAGWRLARESRAALVFDAHESYPDMLASNVAAPIKGVCRVMERFLVRRVDLLVTVGERLREHYERMGASRTVVSGNWRDPLPSDRASRDDRIARRRRLGVGDGEVLVCFIANLTPERQLQPLLDAVRNTPGVHLAVGGRGCGADVARRAAATCDRIHFLGLVEPCDVPRWTAASDAVYYGFDPRNRNARFSAPNKLFEALAAGVPVLTGYFGEIGEVVSETGCGIVLPEYDVASIHSALQSLQVPRHLAELRRFAREASTRYSRRLADASLLHGYEALPRRRRWTLERKREIA